MIKTKEYMEAHKIYMGLDPETRLRMFAVIQATIYKQEMRKRNALKTARFSALIDGMKPEQLKKFAAEIELEERSRPGKF